MANGGYLAGGYYQVYNNLESKGTPDIVKLWGLETDDAVFFGQSYIGGNSATYSWLYLTDQSTIADVFKIVGGYQVFAYDNTQEQDFAWGSPGSLYSDREVYQSTAYDNNAASWVSSGIHFYLTPADNNQTPGFRLVGFRQLARDLESKQPYVTINEWGDTSAQEQFIGIGKAWSQPYGWGFSQISVFLAPA